MLLVLGRARRVETLLKDEAYQYAGKEQQHGVYHAQAEKIHILIL
jgi:hypothetical protein